MECHRLLPRSNSRFTSGARARDSPSQLPSDEELESESELESDDSWLLLAAFFFLGPPCDFRARLPYRGSPPLQSGGQNQKWPTSGQIGYLTPAVSGSPTASERGAKSEVAHKWANWLPHPCRIGEPHRCRAGGKIRSGPLVGKLATSPLPYRGAPPLQSGGQNQKWPTSGQGGYPVT